MCDPASIAGAALGVGGILLNNRAQSQAAAERNRALAAERRRQEVLRKEAFQTLKQTIGGFDRPAQESDRVAAEVERTASAEGAMDTGPQTQYSPATGGAPKVVTAEIAKRLSDALGAARTQAQAMGKLGSYGDLDFGNRIKLAQSGSEIGMIGGFSRGSAGVLPLELNAAAVNNQPSGIGDLLQGAGQLFGLMGATGTTPWSRTKSVVKPSPPRF